MRVIVAEQTAKASVEERPTWLADLRSTAAVRERCLSVYNWVAAGHSRCMTVDENKLHDVANYVAAACRANYPALEIPYHSRWRHFFVGGIDRWLELKQHFANETERLKSAFDLTFVSVLLDAGAGDSWRYRDATSGQTLARSEGLAIASFEMFRSGALSRNPAEPLRVDSAVLRDLEEQRLAAYFQVTADNPIAGFSRRVALLRRLGEALPGRPGDLIDEFDSEVSASRLLSSLLERTAPIWPDAFSINGWPIGDAGCHAAVKRPDPSSQIVPFHKLSQWLVYSLVEPLQDAGYRVTDLEQLTGLPEYRNGGLFFDFGVIALRDPDDAARTHALSSPLVVEWRALTVILLDRLLPLVRERLRIGEAFALPHLLQGGTWSAGRQIAAERRPSGVPPLRLSLNGTVF